MVYENREVRSGRTIEINVVVVRARGSKVELAPLFFFAGGPGGSASHSAATAAGMFADVGLTRDIVYVDQRGSQGSSFLLCPERQEFEREQ